MSTIIPQSELVRRAAEWLRAELASHPDRPVESLLDEAGMRYNLSPKESAMLADFFRDAAERVGTR